MEAAVTRRADRVRREAMQAAVPAEAGARVNMAAYRSLGRRFAALMDVAMALGSGRQEPTAVRACEIIFLKGGVL